MLELSCSYVTTGAEWDAPVDAFRHANPDVADPLVTSVQDVLNATGRAIDVRGNFSEGLGRRELAVSIVADATTGRFLLSVEPKGDDRP